MTSILDHWHPVTHDFGLIRAPLSDMLTNFESWHRSLGIEYEQTLVSSSLEDAFSSLLPLTHGKTRRIFVPTRSDWIACFQNGIQGSDPFPAMSYLATHMDVLAMRVCRTPPAARYQGVVWEVYAPPRLGGAPPLGYRRAISAMNDGGRWTFTEAGERYPFEQVERYDLRRVRDRFTGEMLQSYARQFGIEPFDDSFFQVSANSPAIRLQQRTKLHRTPEFTLEEVVAGVPWR